MHQNQRKDIYRRALDLEFISTEEGALLFREAPLAELMAAGYRLRQLHHPGNKVTWLIDRNVNITNVCASGCQFCNYFRAEKSPEAFITSPEEYRTKIEEMKQLGGEQLLLQGGMHPKLGLAWYRDLFSSLKREFPWLKLHALGPPEVVFLAKMEQMTVREVLQGLVDAGLDSLPGAGAEILSDRVRQKVSRNKCSTEEWLGVMREAHRMGLTTSATMMFGHLETLEERLEHLVKIRELQAEKPEGATGFISFIPWPFQDKGTVLSKVYGIKNTVTADEYIRMIAIARMMLPNIPNLQASWLTVGRETGQLCLHAGANDFGSIMIEENVVSVAGATYTFDAEGIQRAIHEAGFTPQLRDQQFREREYPDPR